MSLPAGYDECTKKCKSVVHGSRITAACTKRGPSDSLLAGFLFKCCRNFAEVADKEGRTALHLAASTDRTNLVEWLLKNGASVDAKDHESGQTPLHRALFYGCLKSAIVLLRNNASVEVFDVKHLNPLHYCLTSSKRKHSSRRPDTETYAFGSNSHYNLGLDMDQGTPIPKCIEYFKRNSVSIKSVALSAFHSLFLSHTGDLYAVGHGVGGRLGHGQESTVVQPQKLNLRLKRTDEKIISFSASKNHSLILSNLNNIYASGANSRGQLGIKSNDANLFEFKNINCSALQDQNLVRVIALDNHSIAYSTACIFAWGQNTGQLGLRSTESVISTPQLVLSGQQIVLFDACNSGMAFYSGGTTTLNIFNNYKMRFFKTPSLEALTQLSISDAEKSLKVLLMTASNQVYIWDDQSQQYTKCYYTLCPQFETARLFWSGSRVVFLAGGDLFMSTSLSMVKYSGSEEVSEYQEIYSSKKDICQTHRMKISLKRTPFASHVKEVWTDSDGLNCIFIRDDPYMHLKVPTLHEQDVALDTLHDEMSEFDGVHDVVFHVDRESFPAHKYVLLSRAGDAFGPWLEGSEDKKNCYLDVEGLTAAAFGVILKIVYKNQTVTEQDIQRLGGDLTSFTKLMKRLNLGRFLEKSKKNLPKMHFDRNAFPELFDVTIKCANDRFVQAHKCILVSRLKYFHMMFSSSWMESSEVNFSTIPVEYCESLVDFLYHNSPSRLLAKKYTESFIKNMIVIADQLFCDRLKDVFQVHMLRRYTMKRTAEWLELAVTYHCDLLKQSLMDFLCVNLREVLENRMLEHVDLEYLSELDERYREMYPEIKYRQVLPSPAIDDEYIEAFAGSVNIDLNAVNGNGTAGNQKGTAKGAVKEPKSATKTKVDYEKEGKLSLQLKGEQDQKVAEQILVVKSAAERNLATILSDESQRILTELQEKNQSIWTKVTEKKPEPKRRVAVGALNANEVLRNEEKMCENFSNLKLLSALNGEKTPNHHHHHQQRTNDEGPANQQLSVEHSPPPSQLNSAISLGDFLSPPSGGGSGSGRMSQKQRKRQNSRQSESENNGGDLAYYPPPSVWNVPANDATPPLGTSTTPLDFGDCSRKSRTSNSGSSLKKNKEKKSQGAATRMINFDAILVEERKEKEYFEKLKSKPLHQTQLEEAAIGELLVFYNVEQVFDETIVIVRKVRQQVSQNFSQWGRLQGDAGGGLEYVPGAVVQGADTSM